jgi:DNA-binding CsgD family transcriptional regulator
VAKEEMSAMYLSQHDAARLGELVNWLSQSCSQQEIRAYVGEALLRILKADYYASFVWDEAAGAFADAVAINMSVDNLSAYEEYFQYRDPITPELQKRRMPTLVTQIMPQDELTQTEFFNDFLAKDGLCYGVNLYAYAGAANIGDMRIWRNKRRGNFDETALLVLAIIQPAFTAALQRARDRDVEAARASRLTNLPTIQALSRRELMIARCVANSMSDKQIARELGIEFSTVRTHLGNVFQKLDVQNRAQLIRLFSHLGV